MFGPEFIGSDFVPTQNPAQSLARYKSAPGSFLAALSDSYNNNNAAADISSGGDESEALFSALIMSGGGDHMMIKREGSPEPRPGSVAVQAGLESAVSGGGGFIVGSYSVGMETQVNTDGGSTSAAFLNGFGNYRVHNIPSSADHDTNGLMSFSSAPSSSAPFMPCNDTVFPLGPWNEASFSGGLKRNREGERRMFSEFGGLDNRNIGESRKGSSGLVHHLSLPKTSAEMADVEKFLQFQTETVPCQVRAKRGCATHPRSIAERVRRTRISEKMKKMQDLFPNMDKQTSTADMLDLAVEYIKDLQKQVESLVEVKTRCVCSTKAQQHG